MRAKCPSSSDHGQSVLIVLSLIGISQPPKSGVSPRGSCSGTAKIYLFNTYIRLNASTSTPLEESTCDRTYCSRLLRIVFVCSRWICAMAAATAARPSTSVELSVLQAGIDSNSASTRVHLLVVAIPIISGSVPGSAAPGMPSIVCSCSRSQQFHVTRSVCSRVVASSHPAGGTCRVGSMPAGGTAPLAHGGMFRT